MVAGNGRKGAELGGVFSGLAVAGLGLAVLAGGRLAPSGAGPETGLETRMIGVVLPPWQDDALARVVATGFPIVDMRAGGLVAVVAADGAVRARLSKAGFVLVATRGAGLCLPQVTGDGR